jgi:hypothetical protein
VEAIARRASVAQVGGFRPPDDPLTSWLGAVKVALPGEGWPMEAQEPMLALAQVNVDELPIRPPALAGVALVTLFVGPRKLPIDEPNGSNWCLRTYATTTDLQPLDAPPPVRAGDPKLRKGEAVAYKAFPVQWREVTDWPSHDDVDTDEDLDPPHPGFKVGGWPLCVQHEVSWEEGDERLDEVDFVMQIDSESKIGFEVGYGGVCYIGRRTPAGTWHFSFQSM